MRRLITRHTALALLLAGATAVTSCSASGEEGSAEASPSASTTTAPERTEEPEPEYAITDWTEIETTEAAEPEEEEEERNDHSVYESDVQLTHHCEDGQDVYLYGDNVQLTLTGSCGLIYVSSRTNGLHVTEATEVFLDQQSSNTFVRCENPVSRTVNLGAANLLMGCVS